MTTATAITVTADQVVAGDILVSWNLRNEPVRDRVTRVERLDVRVGGTVHPTVRLHILGSVDYSPASVVTIVR